jgi:hypothetical protein
MSYSASQQNLSHVEIASPMLPATLLRLEEEEGDDGEEIEKLQKLKRDRKTIGEEPKTRREEVPIGPLSRFIRRLLS